MLDNLIDKKWHQLKKSDVLVHLATDGGYKVQNLKCYNFNYIKSKLIYNAYYSGCRKWIIAIKKKKNNSKILA